MGNFKRRADVRAAWIHAIQEMDADVFGTLKFMNGDAMTYEHALLIWRKFWRRVDRTIFKPAITNNKDKSKNAAIDRWCFVELGESGTNWHMHFVAKAPFAKQRFCDYLNATWATLDEKTSNNFGSEITPIVSPVATAAYVTKDIRHELDEAASIHCSARNNPKYAYDTLNLDDVYNRIRARLSVFQLHQAEQAVNLHIERVAERMARKEQVWARAI